MFCLLSPRETPTKDACFAAIRHNRPSCSGRGEERAVNTQTRPKYAISSRWFHGCLWAKGLFNTFLKSLFVCLFLLFGFFQMYHEYIFPKHAYRSRKNYTPRKPPSLLGADVVLSSPVHALWGQQRLAPPSPAQPHSCPQGRWVQGRQLTLKETQGVCTPWLSPLRVLPGA